MRVHAFEIEVELGVGVEALQFLGELQGQRGLADSSHSLKAEDGSGATSGQGGFQSGEVLGAAGEVGGWGEDLVEGGDGGDLRDGTYIDRRGASLDLNSSSLEIPTGGGDQISSRLGALDADLASPI
jgi:hypothetical protein